MRSGLASASRNPGVGLRFKRKGAVPVLQVEVEEKDTAVLPIGEKPREVGLRRCCADTASRADDGNHFAELPTYRAALRPLGCRRQGLCQ